MGSDFFQYADKYNRGDEMTIKNFAILIPVLMSAFLCGMIIAALVTDSAKVSNDIGYVELCIKAPEKGGRFYKSPSIFKKKKGYKSLFSW